MFHTVSRVFAISDLAPDFCERLFEEGNKLRDGVWESISIMIRKLHVG